MTDRPKREGIMLAYPAEEKRVQRLGRVFYMQPKLNGERCRVAVLPDGSPILLSSYANEFVFMDHLVHDVAALWAKLGERVLFDGELYTHGWSREQIHSAVAPKVNKSRVVEQVEYHIFDIQSEEIQMRRFEKLSKIFPTGSYGNLILVPFMVSSPDYWQQHVVEYCSDGYEGGILRALDGHYTPRRSTEMLKFKPTEKDEYIIVGVTEGVGWAEGMLGSFQVKGDDGTVFSVGSGALLTKKHRAELWSVRRELVGRVLVVKHEKLVTTNRIPVCTVALAIG